MLFVHPRTFSRVHLIVCPEVDTPRLARERLETLRDRFLKRTRKIS